MRSSTLAAGVATGWVCLGSFAFAQDGAPIEGAATAAAAPTIYHFEHIAPPPGFHSIRLEAINNAGDAAGIVERHYDPSLSLVIRRADGETRILRLPDICSHHSYVRVLRFNDLGQLLLDTSHCGSSTRSMLWGPRSGWKAIPQLASSMNDHGDVVGTTDHQQGFVWKWSGEYQTFDLDGGVAFAGINDRREIAGTITHIADPDRPYDRDGVTGALLKDGRDPVYTGDEVIQSLADYKNPEYRQHHVASNAGAINERGSIGLVMARVSVGRPACLWHRKETLRCAQGVRRRSMIVGVDGQDRLVFAEDTAAQASFVLLPDGSTWYLNDIVDQSSIRPLGARGVSESGLVVGYVARHDTGSFILTPIDGAR